MFAVTADARVAEPDVMMGVRFVPLLLSTKDVPVPKLGIVAIRL